ncbi:putative DNA-binding pseudobarrel domain superfamily [Helianthus annuus]|uniref:DNA-binding pseudobarrel domain superfamily n=1 Tax=Helianthus annuus TaxID=4232 RepID=A0A251VA98_HELAN|nr:B3 domain-containing protein At2g31720 [Helianthus annuus]KAF5815034.1 putative DNA-binding pseudobarrel domain superfamily [Helianthus annuus]KAJ0601509.1 putative DNA-binding pseudobarrel domain superfamily [Helianthus annuus]KAJ0608593.1 putative DNA-binding pseudobarrel domain superfamily [Helianthus annuus]KAJ0768659.1 putative DNA-binding pseudobarrel domain superfamily [Helianthus annuus]KAJ0774403.1 putative DNA-binding pseudobarrel domain superfamily [Helianthus annuus]
MNTLLSLNVRAPFAAPSSFSFYDHSLQLEEEDGHDHREDALAADKVMIKKRKSCLLLENDSNKKKIRKMSKKMKCGPVVNDDSIVRLKRFITGEMYGLDMKLVIQKVLYESDMKKDQNRLNMPIKQLVTKPHEFLTDDEIRMVDKDGIEVRVVGSMMQMYARPLWLKKWPMKKSDNYVLKTNWNNFVVDNEGLKKDTMIQVWAFRKDRQLCFAIVPVERTDAVNDAA